MGLSKEELTQRNEERRIKKWHEQHKIIDGVDHKKCNKCELYQPANEDYFYYNKSNGIDGLSPTCKSCQIIKASIWQTVNREKKRAAQRKYNVKPETRVYQREKGKERREQGYFKEYFNNNPTKQLEYAKRHSIKKHNITPKEWLNCKRYFDYCCAYCGKSWDQNKKETKKDLHREHAHDDGLNDLSNCVPACRDCNSRKCEKDLTAWFDEIMISDERRAKIERWLTEDYFHYIDETKRNNQ